MLPELCEKTISKALVVNLVQIVSRCSTNILRPELIYAQSGQTPVSHLLSRVGQVVFLATERQVKAYLGFSQRKDVF
jgi:hypothetical protein